MSDLRVFQLPDRWVVCLKHEGAKVLARKLGPYHSKDIPGLIQKLRQHPDRPHEVWTFEIEPSMPEVEAALAMRVSLRFVKGSLLNIRI